MENAIILHRRKIIVFILMLLMLLVLWNIWSYFHSGTIEVTTGTNNSVITISSAKEDNVSTSNTNYIKQSTSGSLKISLPLGNYLLSVGNKYWSINRIANLTKHEALNYHLDVPKALNPVPVVSADTSSMAADSSNFVYLDNSTHQIQQIGSNNNITTLNSQSFVSIGWANTSYGIGQDEENHLYVIDDGQVAPLRIPVSYRKGQSVLYSVTPNRQIYLAFGATIYSGTQSGGFKKIYQAAKAPDKLVGSVKGVVIFNTPDLDDNDSNNQGVVLISNNGKRVYVSTSRVNNASWSPDGTKVALQGNPSYGSYSYIVDDSLKQLVVLPNVNIGALVWINNNVLVYSIGNIIWSYNIQRQEASVIAVINPENTINQLITDAGSNNVYAASDANNGGEIDRVPLKNQPIPQVAYQISTFFPDELDNGSCAVNYSDFTQPTLNVESISNLVDCQPVVLSALQQDDIYTNQLQINYGVEAQGE